MTCPHCNQLSPRETYQAAIENHIGYEAITFFGRTPLQILKALRFWDGKTLPDKYGNGTCRFCFCDNWQHESFCYNNPYVVPKTISFSNLWNAPHDVKHILRIRLPSNTKLREDLQNYKFTIGEPMITIYVDELDWNKLCNKYGIDNLSNFLITDGIKFINKKHKSVKPSALSVITTVLGAWPFAETVNLNHLAKSIEHKLNENGYRIFEHAEPSISAEALAHEFIKADFISNPDKEVIDETAKFCLGFLTAVHNGYKLRWYITKLKTTLAKW